MPPFPLECGHFSPHVGKYKNSTDVIPVPLQHIFLNPCPTGFWAHFAVFMIKSPLSFCKARSSAFRELPLGKKLNRWMPDHSEMLQVKGSCRGHHTGWLIGIQINCSLKASHKNCSVFVNPLCNRTHYVTPTQAMHYH